MAAVENVKAHYPSSSPAAATARAARPASYSRADCPTAAHITSSKSSSSLKPAARAAAKSASAAAPADPVQAAHIACEHFAFAPDNVLQNSDSFPDYVESLVGVNLWGFWWD